MDYLLKPFSVDALENSIKKYEYYTYGVGQETRKEDSAEPYIPLGDWEAPKANTIPRILIQQSDSYNFIPIEKVRWLQC